MITRNRIEFSENQAALIWQHVVGKEILSIANEPLKAIYPGRINGDSGPDFRDAVILSKSHLTRGDVEVHVRSSDWYNHEHHTDAAYNNVILHVALWHDCSSATILQNGKSVPLLCLAKALRHQAYLLPQQLPCFQMLDRMDMQALGNILNSAGEERFRQKARHFRTEILRPPATALSVDEAAGQVLLRGIMRALGYAKNTEPFEDLADRALLTHIESREGLTPKKALLLGTAGLLPSQRRRGELGREREARKLEQIWQSTSREVSTMNESDWVLSHIYPNNSPVRRIVALSYLLERYHREGLLAGLLRLAKEAQLPGGHHVLEEGLTVAGDGYWLDHFDFGLRSRTRLSALLGHSKAREIAVNVVLPLAFSWGKLTHDLKLREQAIELYRSYPKLVDNCITRHMAKQLGLERLSGLAARHQQGLIHVFRNHCREGRCRQCPLVR